MKKRLLKSAVTTALAVAFAVPAFANPFSDVPQGHWAYNAVNDLAQAGVVEGYDGKFNGNQTMTRYEMAQVVANAMTKSMNDEQKETVDSLSKEFATELINLGVKVDGLENKVDDMVKISGTARVRYHNIEKANDVTDYRARLTFDGKINDNMKFNARIASGNADADSVGKGISLETANINFNTFGLSNTVGRQDIKLGSGFLMDAQANAIASKIGNLTVFGGNVTKNAANDTAIDERTWDRVYGAEYGMNLMGVKLTADYLNNSSTDEEIYGGQATAQLLKGVTASAEYFKNNDADAAAQAYGVKLNKLGLSATYRDVEEGALTAFSTLNTNGSYDAQYTGFKGMEYQFDKGIAKNTNLSLKYQDFEDQDGDKLAGRGIATVEVKF
ncbi:S-layer homology domain-containing protein [Acetonema longum]|uniref:S-layer domain protein n=1 Tax=Acetonema longum DSM 6540 TaxID=1009370 RepID=F7NLZ4_9FIRM|nr:S-layer homology domain-containing protein [Acetonema longum]EGO62920.1 S-layer domain protein [Acetonema longum DSM 6540]